jgi:hypothetical protein
MGITFPRFSNIISTKYNPLPPFFFLNFVFNPFFSKHLGMNVWPLEGQTEF